jgi:uncharacterized membrane protein YhdT
MTDSIIYWAIMLALLLFIGWLLLAPAPGHDPLVSFQHAALVA